MGSDDIHRDLRVYLAEVGNEPVGTATVMEMPNLTYGCAPREYLDSAQGPVGAPPPLPPPTPVDTGVPWKQPTK